MVRRGLVVAGLHSLSFLAGFGEAGGEVGFPGEFRRVAEEPVAAPGDGGFDFGNAGDRPLDVSEASSAPLQLTGASDAFILESSQVAPGGVDTVLGLVDGVVVAARNRRGRVSAWRWAPTWRSWSSGCAPRPAKSRT